MGGWSVAQGRKLGIYWPDFCNSSPAWTAGTIARRLRAVLLRTERAFSRTEPRTSTSRVRLLPGRAMRRITQYLTPQAVGA